MKVVEKESSLRELVTSLKKQGLSCGFVPTMGNLHAGHLALVDAAAESCDRVIVSIFVNPLQFGPDEDFDAYPDTPIEDEESLREHAVDILYRPTIQDIYPQGLKSQTKVEVPGLSEILCGLSRPGHFTGVTTVVNRLFNQVQADKAFFGKKDYQQYLLIKKMVSDLAMDVEIVGIDTVRLDSGLAMSSRNNYLSSEEINQAENMYRVLQKIVHLYRTGEATIIDQGLTELKSRGFEPEYLTVRRQSDLAEAEVGEKQLIVLAAAWLGKTRLIDNLEFTLPGV